MSDKDLEEFGFEPIADQDLEEFGFEEQTIPEEDIGYIETIGRGTLQGLTFDHGDELLGALQATAGKVQGEGDFAELYKKYRDQQRKKMEQAAEENPITYYGSDIASGIIPALFTGGAGAAAAVGKTAMKQGAKAAVKPAVKAAKIGGAMGLATGSGISEADLTEGDVGGFAKDVAIGGISGAGLGAVTPALAKVGGKVARKTGEIAKGITRALPGAEAAELAFKAGTKGIGVSQKAILDEAEKVAAKLNDKIMKVLAKSGVDRGKAVKLADKAGKRLNAGKVFDDIINDIIEEGAIGLDMKSKQKLLDNISSFKKGFEEQKIFKDLESKLAKQALNEDLKFGSQLETVTEIKRPFGDILINPEGKGNVFGMRAKYSAPGPMGERIEYVKNILKDVKDSPIKKIMYDIENAKPSEVKAILDKINKELVGDVKKAPVGEEATYRKLAVELRKILDGSVEKFTDPTGTMKGIYRGAEELGIKEAGRGTQDAIEKNIKTIAKKLSSSGNASELDKRLAFRKFREASPEFADVIDEAEFISKLNDKLGGMTEGVPTTNIKGLIGTAEGSVAKIANVAGKGATAIKPVTDATKKIANKVMNYPEDKLKVASKWLNSKENKALNAMGQQLEYALQQEDGTIRNALIWSLSQQPAFRREVDKAIESQESNYMQDLGLQQSDFTEPPSSDESVFALPPEMEEEKEDNVGRSPAANVPIVEEEDLDSMPFADAFEAHYQKVKDLPVEERPNLIWKGGEYKAVKEGEESNYNKNKPSDFSKLKKGYKVPEDYLENIPKHDKEDVEKVYRNVAEGTGLSPEEVALIGGLESFHGKLQLPLNRKTGKLISSAKGLFQFIDETRNNLTKSINSKGISLSGNPFSLEDQEKLMVELLNENKKQLKGFDPTPENQNIYELYTMHLLGPDRAKKLMTSDPETPVESILPDYVIEGNSNLLKGKNVLEAMEAIKDYLNKKGRGFEFSNQNKSVSNVFEDGGVALNEVEKNITREKKQLGSGAIAGTERSTLDDLLGSLRKLQGVSEEDMDKMEESAYSGDMNKLQELLDKLKMA